MESRAFKSDPHRLNDTFDFSVAFAAGGQRILGNTLLNFKYPVACTAFVNVDWHRFFRPFCLMSKNELWQNSVPNTTGPE